MNATRLEQLNKAVAILQLIAKDENADRQAVKETEAPKSFREFCDRQAAIHEEKEHDYGSRYMKALIQYGRVIWIWESQKKLDRLRTWINKGELKVKGEGIDNAIGDLFNYTVQWDILRYCWVENSDPFTSLTKMFFLGHALNKSPNDWVEVWRDAGLIGPGEESLETLIIERMGAYNG